MQGNQTGLEACDASALSESEPKLGWVPIALEAEILAVLDAPKMAHETFDAALRRKEHEIGAVLSRLMPTDSLALERRLTLSLADDPIAARFARFVPERRKRLLSFISAMRRRPLRS